MCSGAPSRHSLLKLPSVLDPSQQHPLLFLGNSLPPTGHFLCEAIHPGASPPTTNPKGSQVAPWSFAGQRCGPHVPQELSADRCGDRGGVDPSHPRKPGHTVCTLRLRLHPHLCLTQLGTLLSACVQVFRASAHSVTFLSTAQSATLCLHKLKSGFDVCKHRTLSHITQMPQGRPGPQPSSEF